MQCLELMDRLNKLAPQEYACDWDNPGFQVGRGEKQITKILVALDVTDEVVEQALVEQVDMVITHHPLIFKPLKQVNDRNFITRRIVTMLQADLCYAALHTNFDVAPGCMGDLAAARLSMTFEEPLEITGEVDGVPMGVGKVGTLPHPVSLEELAKQVKEAFELPFVTVYGMEQVTEPVSRIAVSPGAGGSVIRYGLEKQVQVLVTGDIGHHSGIDAAANHMAVIDAGHYGLEHIFISFMAGYLKQLDPAFTVITAAPAFPERVV